MRDASKSVCCFALVHGTHKMRSPAATPKPATCPPSELPAITQWLERPTGLWKVVASIPAGGSDFFSEHFLVVLNIYFYFHHNILTANIKIILP